MEDLLTAAGFTRTRTRTRRVTVRFANVEHWHRFTMSVGQRAFWGFVPEERRDDVRAEAFRRLAPATGPDGTVTLWQDARYTTAERP